MPTKRKLDFFDPNKSDSEDENFEPEQNRGPVRSKKRSRTGGSHSRSSKKKKRSGYGGSDISEDDVSDSLLEESFSEEDEAEEDEDLETGGRRRRQAARKQISYQESSESEEEFQDSDKDSSDEEEQVSATPKKKSHVVTLKVPLSAIRTRRQQSIKEEETAEESVPAPPRRVTRAQSEEAGDLYSLTNSGRHAQVTRASGSPEVVARTRLARGGKGLKKPVTVIPEEPAEQTELEPTQEADEPSFVEQEGEEEEEEAVAAPAEAVDEPEEMAIDDEREYAEDLPATQLADDEDDDDEGPITRGTRTRSSRVAVEDEEADPSTPRRSKRSSRLANKRSQEVSSDFEPPEESAEESESDGAKKGQDDDDEDDSPAPRGRNQNRGKSKSSRNSRRRAGSEDEEIELDHEELADELQELQSDRRKRRRRDADIVVERTSRIRKPVDYSIRPLDQIYAADEEAEEEAAATPSRGGGRRRAGVSHAWERPLYTTFGPFGGAGGPTPVIGGPWGTGAIGGVDSDSSDDENMARPNVAGHVGMTPTTAVGGLLPGLGQPLNNDPTTATSGTPSNFGKIKSQKALADADPLGVDQNVDFSKVGGLQGHIDQLKEMVQMPLLYPELFLKFHVTPPRGVLFHGPPGTGKTLLARALAAQVGTGGRKITFYMRKGADALSKWVGEAERQLRLLFEEARKTQPSIIFFDEIDGLAPVRSSKQEQIHASIVSTLLALMDGMDGRGQVIVIGATNRPDNIDPALRRPGRFDREFYFPLPDTDARKSIINIHTRDWGIDDTFKESLAHVTKGYGGADLRALCTEAALNAIQRTYPQIYSSNEKLMVDPAKIKVTAKDFMLSVKKLIPSSERSTSSGASPLPKNVEPLLRDQLKEIEVIVDGLIPLKKKTTALQEAMYEQYDDADQGFGRETLLQEFEKSRVFRPRLLICGEQGMGQSYIGAALLNHFEGLHVQNFDLPTIYSDSARSAETAIVQLFAEVKRHKPSVIYLPGIDTWYQTVSEPVITTFLGLLRGLPPTDPVLVLGITDQKPEKINPALLRDFFGFSRKNRFVIGRPSQAHREEFFANVITYIRKAPRDFPEPSNRKKRKLEILPLAPPPEPPKAPSKEEIKAQKKKDHQFLNVLKVNLQPIMDQIQKKYKKFRQPVIPQSQIQYLLDEQDPNFMPPEVPQFRPFEIGKDRDGITGLFETTSGKFFYNLETTTIEERLSNGFYARPKDFVADIRSLAKDAKNIGDRDRMLKANELLANVEVDVGMIEQQPAMADAENVYRRQLQRAKEREEKYNKQSAVDSGLAALAPADRPTAGHDVIANQASSGPITLGEPIPKGLVGSYATSSLSNGHASHSVPTSNGDHVPSRDESGDVQMGGTQTQESAFTSKPATQASQISGFQVIGQNDSPSALVNDASTTTTSKRTSDPRSSDQWSTQATNGGTASSQAYSAGGRAGEDNELPDTQRETQEQSDDQWPHSQAHGLARGTLAQPGNSQTPSSQTSTQPPVPPFHAPSRNPRGGLSNILNDEPEDISQNKEVILDESYVVQLQTSLTTRTSGCSIEQLEQINRELMDTVWRLRGEYNRTRVATEVMSVFNEVIADIEEMQRVFVASQEDGVMV